MNKASTYLLSIITSVFLVFMLLASSAVILMNINLTSDDLKDMAVKNELSSKICTDINKYYTDKYNTTGIPADVYMDAISESYIASYVNAYIDSAFDSLESDGKIRLDYPENKKLEENIENFFNDFAEKNNYKKDDKFELKLRNTKDNAYTTIGSYCDVYKFSAMSDHGILPKLAKVYSHRVLGTALAVAATAILILLLIAINHKKKITVMYWCGISALTAGFIGGIPSIYLLITKYFDSFSIKQAPVFTAFTSVMYKLTEAYTAVNIAYFAISVSMIVTYGIIHDKKKYPKTKPTEIG